MLSIRGTEQDLKMLVLNSFILYNDQRRYQE